MQKSVSVRSKVQKLVRIGIISSGFAIIEKNKFCWGRKKRQPAYVGGGLRRDGPNDFLFVNNLIHKDLSISILFVLLVMFSIICNLSTIHNLATYAY